MTNNKMGRLCGYVAKEKGAAGMINTCPSDRDHDSEDTDQFAKAQWFQGGGDEK